MLNLTHRKKTTALGSKGRKITAAFGQLLEAVCSGESISPKLEKALVTRVPNKNGYGDMVIMSMKYSHGFSTLI